LVYIDLAAARARGTQVVNTPGRNASAVAEFAIGAILSQTRMITRGHDALRRGDWRGDLYRTDLTGDELSEMTVGIIGYGHIGTRVVRLLKAFGYRILVCDPYVQLAVEDLNDGVAQVNLDRMLAQSDVVTLHPRVTEETRGMIGTAQFAAMKPGTYFINTARGPLVDYQALNDALVSNHLRGAAIETFAIEPVPPNWPLLQLPNVTLTPHIAGGFRQNRQNRGQGGGPGGASISERRIPPSSLLSCQELTMADTELQLRKVIVDKCRWMNATGLNQGTSGNISARHGDTMLISPSATPYDSMTPDMIAVMPIAGEYGSWEGPLKPSTEWRFHLDIMKARPEVGGIVHTHATYSTVLAIAHKEIPACHYMMAAFGGMNVRVADYARFGTKELSDHALKALENRTACLLANHGMIATGTSLDKAMWLAVELETIARQYYLTLAIGGPVLLSETEIRETAVAFGSYGVQDPHSKTAKKTARE
jgi:L-fuculose-phosphate aldolase